MQLLVTRESIDTYRYFPESISIDTFHITNAKAAAAWCTVQINCPLRQTVYDPHAQFASLWWTNSWWIRLRTALSQIMPCCTICTHVHTCAVRKCFSGFGFKISQWNTINLAPFNLPAWSSINTFFNPFDLQNRQHTSYGITSNRKILVLLRSSKLHISPSNSTH